MQTRHGAVTTTDGEIFSLVEHVDLARLIYKRFGHDLVSATAAWCRLFGNDTEQTDFCELLSYPEHTPHCEGDCICYEPENHDHDAAVRAVG